MAKTNDAGATQPKKEPSYPCYGLSSALRVAEAVKDLGGNKTPVAKSLLVRKLNTTDSPTFSQLLSAAKAFRLIEGIKEYVLTKYGKRYFYPTTDTETRAASLECLFGPTSFRKLIDRFDGQRLPSASLLGNILLDGGDVPTSWAPRVAGIFLASAKELDLIDSDGILRYAAEMEHLKQQGGRNGNGGQPEDDAVTYFSSPASAPSPPPPSVDRPPLRLTTDSSKTAVFTHPSGVRVETPEPLTKSVWELLRGYVALLEPPAAPEKGAP